MPRVLGTLVAVGVVGFILLNLADKSVGIILGVCTVICFLLLLFFHDHFPEPLKGISRRFVVFVGGACILLVNFPFLLMILVPYLTYVAFNDKYLGVVRILAATGVPLILLTLYWLLGGDSSSSRGGGRYMEWQDYGGDSYDY